MMVQKRQTTTLGVQANVGWAGCNLRSVAATGAALILLQFVAAPLVAHDLPWRPGETRQLGFGHCSKGPCTKRICWAEYKPHRHIDGKVIVDRYMSPECWEQKSEL